MRCGERRLRLVLGITTDQHSPVAVMALTGYRTLKSASCVCDVFSTFNVLGPSCNFEGVDLVASLEQANGKTECLLETVRRRCDLLGLL